MLSFRIALRKLFLLIPLAFLAINFQGCDSTESNNSTVSLSFATPGSLQKITDNTLTIDSVKILIRDVKLGYEAESEEDNGNDGKEASVKVGPFVVHLNLAGTTTEFAVSSIPEGTYNKVKFKIHKIEASENPPDPEFKEGDDSSLRYSVIVKGNFNMQPFIYKSRKSAHQKIQLDEPLVVIENTAANLSITVDPSTWFLKGGKVLDPNNPDNRNDIDNNIKDSFKRCYKH